MRSTRIGDGVSQGRWRLWTRLDYLMFRIWLADSVGSTNADLCPGRLHKLRWRRRQTHRNNLFKHTVYSRKNGLLTKDLMFFDMVHTRKRKNHIRGKTFRHSDFSLPLCKSSQKLLETTRKSVSSESLFLDKNVSAKLRIFTTVMFSDKNPKTSSHVENNDSCGGRLEKSSQKRKSRDKYSLITSMLNGE